MQFEVLVLQTLELLLQEIIMDEVAERRAGLVSPDTKTATIDFFLFVFENFVNI